MRSDETPRLSRRGQRNRTVPPATVEVDHGPDRALRYENSLTLKNGIRLHLQAYGEVFMQTGNISQHNTMFSDGERKDFIKFLEKRV